MLSLKQAKELLRRLECAGFQAVLVGGCVRDLLLERPVHDYDIATDARPEQVAALFDRCIPTGLRHGTVTVLWQEAAYEVTTFRADGVYLDGRRPEQVRFVPCLEADLCRRDFTVNAMAMDRAGRIFDPEGGRADLRRRRIVCVGQPEARFREDALRMLRALRFAAQLDFSIEPETMSAVRRCAALCERLSAERMREELEKTLCSPRPQLASQMMALGLLASLGLTGQPDLTPLQALPPERLVRWAGFCRQVPTADLRRLRLDKKTITGCQRACAAYLDAPTVRQWKQIACEDGWEVAELVGQLNGKSAALHALRATDPCVSLAQLAVDGTDFPNLRGREVGHVLRALLRHVWDCPADNNRTALLRLASQEGPIPKN